MQLKSEAQQCSDIKLLESLIDQIAYCVPFVHGFIVSSLMIFDSDKAVWTIQ